MYLKLITSAAFAAVALGSTASWGSSKKCWIKIEGGCSRPSFDAGNPGRGNYTMKKWFRAGGHFWSPSEFACLQKSKQLGWNCGKNKERFCWEEKVSSCGAGTSPAVWMKKWREERARKKREAAAKKRREKIARENREKSARDKNKKCWIRVPGGCKRKMKNRGNKWFKVALNTGRFIYANESKCKLELQFIEKYCQNNRAERCFKNSLSSCLSKKEREEAAKKKREAAALALKKAKAAVSVALKVHKVHARAAKKILRILKAAKKATTSKEIQRLRDLKKAADKKVRKYKNLYYWHEQYATKARKRESRRDLIGARMAKERKNIKAILKAIKKAGKDKTSDDDKVNEQRKRIAKLFKLEARIRLLKSRFVHEKRKAEGARRTAKRYAYRAKKEAAKHKDFAKLLKAAKGQELEKAIAKNKGTTAVKIADLAHKAAVKQLDVTNRVLAKATAHLLKLRRKK